MVLNNQLSVSIVTYNHTYQSIKPAIDSLLNIPGDFKIFIIDNSPENRLGDHFSDTRFTYIFNNKNIGYGAAHNIALKMAFAEGIVYHLVLNPDVNFESDTFEKLVDFMDKYFDVGLVMPRVLYPDGTIQYLCKLLPTPYDWIGRRFNPFKKVVDKRNQLFELRFTKYSQIMEVPYLSGCFMFLRVDALKKVGLFDENIFMYGEETDLCRRLIAGGYKTVFYPEVSITHEFQKGSHKSWRLTWIGIKSAIYYFNKWGWFFDKERTRINKETLQKLGYKK